MPKSFQLLYCDKQIVIFNSFSVIFLLNGEKSIFQHFCLPNWYKNHNLSHETTKQSPSFTGKSWENPWKTDVFAVFFTTTVVLPTGIITATKSLKPSPVAPPQTTNKDLASVAEKWWEVIFGWTFSGIPVCEEKINSYSHFWKITNHIFLGKTWKNKQTCDSKPTSLSGANVFTPLCPPSSKKGHDHLISSSISSLGGACDIEKESSNQLPVDLQLKNPGTKNIFQAIPITAFIQIFQVGFIPTKHASRYSRHSTNFRFSKFCSCQNPVVSTKAPRQRGCPESESPSDLAENSLRCEKDTAGKEAITCNALSLNQVKIHVYPMISQPNHQTMENPSAPACHTQICGRQKSIRVAVQTEEGT